MMVFPKPSNPGPNPRTRRSACDRCRAYKLRCQRDERPNDPCDRCSKAQLVCTTTLEQTSQRPQQQSSRCGHIRNGGERSGRKVESNNMPREILPQSPERASSPSAPISDQPSRNGSGYGSRMPSVILPSPAAQREYARNAIIPSTLEEARGGAAGWSTTSPTTRRTLEEAGDAMPLDQEEHLGMDGIDFCMLSMEFDPSELSSLITDYPMEYDLDLPRTTQHRRRDGDEGTRRFRHEDFPNADTSNTSTGVPSWPKAGAGPPESELESGREQGTPGGALEEPRSAAQSERDLLKLSLELMEDQEMMSAQAPWPPNPPITPNPLKCSSSTQKQPINRMLDQASRLWDILKCLAAAASEAPPPHTTSTGYKNSANGADGHANGATTGNSARQDPIRMAAGYEDLDPSFSLPFPSYKTSDPILIANLVTTFVCLLRSCRAIFARLHHALLMAPASAENSLISLPGLQFGNFPLENNMAIQVRVLIELTLGMLHRISSALGISPGDGVGSGSSSSRTPGEDAALRIPFLSDPVAISIRQIILSQEMVQSSTQNVDPPPLARIIENIQILLDRQYISSPLS